MEIKGLLTFALGGVLLTILWFAMNFLAPTGPSSFLSCVLFGFFGFLSVGIGLSAIIEDANKKAKKNAS